MEAFCSPHMPIHKLEPNYVHELQSLRRLSDTSGTLGDATERARANTTTAVESLLIPPYETYGAFAGHQLVGAASLSRMPTYEFDPDSIDSFAISSVIVNPEFRRRGVARALMEMCLYQAYHQGAKWVCLVVNTPNPAFNLYESLGFTVWHKKENAYQHDGQSIDELQMSMQMGSKVFSLPKLELNLVEQ